MHFNTNILLELIKSNTPPTIELSKALSFIKSLLAISLNLQSHLTDISSKLIAEV